MSGWMVSRVITCTWRPATCSTRKAWWLIEPVAVLKHGALAAVAANAAARSNYAEWLGAAQIVP